MIAIGGVAACLVHASVQRDDGAPPTSILMAELSLPASPQLIPEMSGKLPSAFDYPTVPSLERIVTASRSGDVRQFPDELASHEIELRSGPDEMANVELASVAIDGVIVHPHEVFSFNSTVGQRSEDRGFRPGLMFQNGEVISGVGGGVCIVSTALYNTVLKAGLKIIERSHHSGPVRYAGPGLDAAVVYGCMDMCFKNDTDSAMMIRSQVVDDRLTIRLVGENRPGLDVKIVQKDFQELPYKVVETEDSAIPDGEVKVKVPARTGFDVTVVRLIKENGKLVKREVIAHDVIPPRDKVVLVPPKPKETEPAKAEPYYPIDAIPVRPTSKPAAKPMVQPEPTAAADNPPANDPDGQVTVRLGIKNAHK